MATQLDSLKMKIRKTIWTLSKKVEKIMLEKENLDLNHLDICKENQE